VKLGPRAPAKLRSLALDTHDTMPAFGASKLRTAPCQQRPIHHRQVHFTYIRQCMHCAAAWFHCSSHQVSTLLSCCLQLSRKQTTGTLGRFGPEDPHQHEMSHANKLAHLAYSKRAHSEWSLLQKWEADVENLSVQERKELLARLKVCSSTLHIIMQQYH